MSELPEVKTIGAVERIVHGSGQWDGTGPVEFSDDGESWVTAWAPSEDHPHPEYARVSTWRKDVRVPTTVTIRWDEQYPAGSEDWSAAWDHAPMRHFERTARMVAFRRTFRDLLGDVRLEDEGHEPAVDATTPSATAAPAAAPARDWGAEIAAADTAERLAVVEKDARSARVFTPDATGTALHRALRARRRELAGDAPAPAVDAAAVVAERRAPQDHRPPANRAQRRAAARQKAGKRWTRR